ncbi:hypothetical protein DFH07DRAFT_949419 [Mycena maculata]|uniref:Uncharacterized protein n=1 Tax=Mycena maculata TaxID=230809 RepID=A0AAD7NZP4_9AGAR|nr:hypothetical protein DFH07DRAFT_949419 [Mycena maculata]
MPMHASSSAHPSLLPADFERAHQLQGSIAASAITLNLMCLHFHAVHPPGHDQVNVLPINRHLLTSPLTRWTEIPIPVPDFMPTTLQYITIDRNRMACDRESPRVLWHAVSANPVATAAEPCHGSSSTPSSAMRRWGWNLTAVKSAPASSNGLDHRRPTTLMVAQLQTCPKVYIAASILLVVLIGSVIPMYSLAPRWFVNSDSLIQPLFLAVFVVDLSPLTAPIF